MVPARAPAANGIRLDVILPGTLAPTALLCVVLPILQPLGGVKAGFPYLFFFILFSSFNIYKHYASISVQKMLICFGLTIHIEMVHKVKLPMLYHRLKYFLALIVCSQQLRFDMDKQHILYRFYIL